MLMNKNKKEEKKINLKTCFIFIIYNYACVCLYYAYYKVNILPNLIAKYQLVCYTLVANNRRLYGFDTTTY